MGILQIQVFGKLRLSYDEVTITTFPTAQVEELLGYLVLNPNIPHLRTKLINLLWPDIDLQKARGRFNTVIWRLKTLLTTLGLEPKMCLQLTRDTITFAPQVVTQYDVALFENYFREASVTTDEVKQEEKLIEVIEHYHGDLLEGIYADWCLNERERFTQSYLQVLSRLMHIYHNRAAYYRAIELAHMILKEDHLQENAHRMIMHCYWKLGNDSQALRQYEHCSQVLQEQLGLLPMSETIDLYKIIITERLEKQLSKRSDLPINRALKNAIVEFELASAQLSALLK